VRLNEGEEVPLKDGDNIKIGNVKFCLFQPVDEVYFDARSNNIPLAFELIAVFNIIGYLFLFSVTVLITR